MIGHEVASIESKSYQELVCRFPGFDLGFPPQNQRFHLLQCTIDFIDARDTSHCRFLAVIVKSLNMVSIVVVPRNPVGPVEGIPLLP